jgi:hypothetical protein
MAPAIRRQQPSTQQQSFQPKCVIFTTTSRRTKTVRWYSKQSRSSASRVQQLLEEEETPAGVVGAQFFGGNKQKEELFDAVAEEQAGITTMDSADRYLFHRFENRNAFGDETVASVALVLQNQISAVLYEQQPMSVDGSSTTTTSSGSSVAYSPNCEWDSPFLQQTNGQTTTRLPLHELQAALDFYNRVDLAITGGSTTVQQSPFVVVQLQWELSVVWPAFWEPRVLLLGSSLVTLQQQQQCTNNNSDTSSATTMVIVKQQDMLLNSDINNKNSSLDLMTSCLRQILPRFWDMYHIGMTPSAEVSPKLKATSTKLTLGRRLVRLLPLSKYQLYDLPARLYLQPQLFDLDVREDGNAGIIPNHAFSCVIKTMGPQRQRYVPASPVEVQVVVVPSDNHGTTGAPPRLSLQWKIPLSVEYQTLPTLNVPGPNEEADSATEPECQYVWQPPRRVATVSFGGSGPQDSSVPSVRQRLYESVVNDGLRPKIDAATGRPVFCFWQNTVKVCYTEEGLGMAVYEWRPELSASNEVGIELEFD